MTESPDTKSPRTAPPRPRSSTHAARIDAAIAHERMRIARELHDVLGAAHTAMRLEVVALITTAPARSAALLARLERIDGLLARCAQARRELVNSLWPEPGQRLALHDALQELCEETATRAGLAVHFHCNCPASLDALPADLAHALLRTTQAALVNSVSHAHAQQLAVIVTLVPGSVSLVVHDDGRGMTAAAHDPRSRGLASMRSRVLELGGHWAIESAPGRGTTVRAWLPR